MRLGTSPVPQVTVRQTADGIYRNWDADVAAARCFAGWAVQTSPGATYPYIQLANPVGSGVELLVDALTFTVDTACQIYVGRTTSLLTSPGDYLVNKYLGQALGKARFYGQNGVISFLESLHSFDIQANVRLPVEWIRPIRISPGHQVMASASTTSTKLVMNAEGREI